jgi:predicted ATPase
MDNSDAPVIQSKDMEPHSRRYIITGGPGSGKSTLIAGLERAGYNCSAEISRKMIKAEVAKNTYCLPWLDISCFSDKVIAEMTRDWKANKGNAVTFFDRGIPDVMAYLKIAGLQVPESYLSDLFLHPYEKEVFILPPWENIYVNDAERWQSFEEATAIYHAIKETYIDLGHHLIELPREAAELRVEFILMNIK